MCVCMWVSIFFWCKIILALLGLRFCSIFVSLLWYLILSIAWHGSEWNDVHDFGIKLSFSDPHAWFVYVRITCIPSIYYLFRFTKSPARNWMQGMSPSLLFLMPQASQTTIMPFNVQVLQAFWRAFEKRRVGVETLWLQF